MSSNEDIVLGDIMLLLFIIVGFLLLINFTRVLDILSYRIFFPNYYHRIYWQNII